MPATIRADKDYYALLGLGPTATEEEVKKSYRRLAFQCHPDRNPGKPEAGERFREISEAYAVLIDPQRRREYDRARQAGATSEFRYSQDDLFRDLFRDPRTSAIFQELAREFERAGMRVDRHYFHRTLFGGRGVVSGGIFIVTPFTPVAALFRLARAALRGARSASSSPEPAARALPLSGSIGRGIGRLASWLLGLPAHSAATISSQAQQDVIIHLPLTREQSENGGTRRLTVPGPAGSEEMIVTIPAGIRAGTRLRLRGKGGSGANGIRGDLYLLIEITGEAAPAR